MDVRRVCMYIYIYIYLLSSILHFIGLGYFSTKEQVLLSKKKIGDFNNVNDHRSTIELDHLINSKYVYNQKCTIFVLTIVLVGNPAAPGACIRTNERSSVLYVRFTRIKHRWNYCPPPARVCATFGKELFVVFFLNSTNIFSDYNEASAAFILWTVK